MGQHPAFSGNDQHNIPTPGNHPVPWRNLDKIAIPDERVHAPPAGLQTHPVTGF